MTIPYQQQAYGVATGTSPIPTFVFRDRDPTTSDITHVLYTQWVNTITKGIWYLEAFNPSFGTILAQWRSLGPVVLSTVSPTSSDYRYPIGQVWVNTALSGTITGATNANPCVITSPDHGLTTGATIIINGVGGMVELNGNEYIITFLTPNTFSINTDSTAFGVYTSGGAWDSSGNDYWVLVNVQNNVAFWSRLAAGSGVEQFNVDANTFPGTDPVVPDAINKAVTITGSQVATGVVGTNVIRTDSLAANTITIEIQRSTAVVATDITKNGVSHFNSGQFTVDGNGFVSLSGGGLAIDSIGVDAFTAPGTNPVAPNGSGQINITGAQVSTGTIGANVIRTDSLAANSLTVEIQRTTTSAASDSTKNGVCHFKSADFAVDGNGFVSLNGFAGFDWNVVNQTNAPANFVINNGYICQAGGTGNVSMALPAVSNLGDTIEIALDGATTWTITQAAGQSIRASNTVTTVGVGGSITTTGTGDAIKLVCETANLRWIATHFIGNLTVT